MSFTSSFFDAVLVGDSYDREYAAEDFAQYFASFIANGVFPNPATQLQVIANITANMQVLVSPGKGWINGYYCTNDQNYPLSISPANGSYKRIDAIVLRWSESDRNILPVVKTGTPSSSPTVPSLTRNSQIYELMLATVTVNAGATSITQAMITDKRSDSTVCGWVKGVVDQIDTTNLFAQYDSAFQTWFADIQAQLSGDVATNLQNQINQLQSTKVNVGDKATSSEATMGTNDSKWMTPKTVKEVVTPASKTVLDTRTNQLINVTSEFEEYQLGNITINLPQTVTNPYGTSYNWTFYKMYSLEDQIKNPRIYYDASKKKLFFFAKYSVKWSSNTYYNDLLFVANLSSISSGAVTATFISGTTYDGSMSSGNEFNRGNSSSTPSSYFVPGIVSPTKDWILIRASYGTSYSNYRVLYLNTSTNSMYNNQQAMYSYYLNSFVVGSAKGYVVLGESRVWYTRSMTSLTYSSVNFSNTAYTIKNIAGSYGNYLFLICQSNSGTYPFSITVVNFSSTTPTISENVQILDFTTNSGLGLSHNNYLRLLPLYQNGSYAYLALSEYNSQKTCTRLLRITISSSSATTNKSNLTTWDSELYKLVHIANGSVNTEKSRLVPLGVTSSTGYFLSIYYNTILSFSSLGVITWLTPNGSFGTISPLPDENSILFNLPTFSSTTLFTPYGVYDTTTHQIHPYTGKKEFDISTKSYIYQCPSQYQLLGGTVPATSDFIYGLFGTQSISNLTSKEKYSLTLI